ncbi:MAG: methylmalonyl Co-A mutase-associated GTPase MeaB [Polyangiaceae bacterium]|nr:methylmalonyl Co-A mutase-associated GTPase MeaB [Polyangiaceae bacterium]
MHPLAERLVAGDVRALARVCRLVDDGLGAYRTILKDLFPATGHAWTIGITGVPGAGKSTLTDQLIAWHRARGRRVGVLCVDPTSPFTGGAILGDRIRMQRHGLDEQVFIRSLATRGALGGLSRSAADLIRVVDAWHADVVVVETVGVGQDELEVTRRVDTTLVVVAPGMGDDVQAIKAGILECADTFAVNKADREGADAAVRHLELMLALGHEVTAPPLGHVGAHAPSSGSPVAGDSGGRWEPPIVRCVATAGTGVDELATALEAHRAWLHGTEAGAARRRERLSEAMRQDLRAALLDAALRAIGPEVERAVAKVAAREIDPYSAADELVAAFRSSAAAGGRDPAT